MIEGRNKLQAAHPLLRRIIRHAARRDPLRVLNCLRTEDEQRVLVDRGFSKTMKSLHLAQADGYAHAVDIVPLINGKPIDTTAQGFGVQQACQFAWFLRAVYESGRLITGRWLNSMGEDWKLRFGVNWDMDKELLTDQGFDDYFHVELRRLG